MSKIFNQDFKIEESFSSHDPYWNSNQFDQENKGTDLLELSDTELEEEDCQFDNNCQYCNQDQLVQDDDGYYVCQNCCSINDRVIDDSQEWRYYGAEDNKSSDPTRCGLPTNNLYPEVCLGSNISLDGQQSWQMRKIVNYHRYNTLPYRIRNLYESLNIMTIYATKGGIAPCIIEEAKNMYRKIVDYRTANNLNEFRKPNREAVLAASILEAARILNYPRSAAEIAQIFKISKTNIIKGYKRFYEYWQIVQNREEASKSAYGDESYAKPSEASDYINRYCSNLEVDKKFITICLDICELVKQKNVAPSYVPISIASGVIYLVNNFLDTELEIGEISEICDQVSEATILKCYQELEKHLEEILPKYLVEMLVKKFQG